jgi:iron complex transport system substrate-binding protein
MVAARRRVGGASQVAPTVFAADVGDAWKENVQLAAEAPGMGQKAMRVMAHHQRAATAVVESLQHAARRR